MTDEPNCIIRHHQSAIKQFIIIALITTYLFVALSAQANEASEEYSIRAAFIYNFLKFVTWPGKDSPSKTGTATICVRGDVRFAAYLRTLQENKAQGIALRVNYPVTASTVSLCQILIIGELDEKCLAPILADAKHYPVLTISEIRNFADNGGMIEMVQAENTIGLFSKDKINLRINISNAQHSGLIIDARLLQIAAEVIK